MSNDLGSATAAVLPRASENSHPPGPCVLSRSSCVQLFATLWTIVHQAPLTMRFSRQDYWRGLPFPPGDFPTQGSNPCLLHLLYCRLIPGP